MRHRAMGGQRPIFRIQRQRPGPTSRRRWRCWERPCPASRPEGAYQPRCAKMKGPPRVPALTCDIPETLMRALEERSARTGESLARIVMAALADALEIEQETLYQVSTSTALVEGVYDGTVTIGDLKQRGNFGLGTFDDLDGEMVALDGGFYQVRGRGEVNLAADTTEVPFAVVTDFRAERTFTLGRISSLEDLAAQLDRQRATDNLFYAVRIGGHFSRIKARAISKTESGVPLIEAAAHQVEYELADVAGTLVGFWTPIYART